MQDHSYTGLGAAWHRLCACICAYLPISVLNFIAGDPIKPGRIQLLASCGVKTFYADENGWTQMHADGASAAAFCRSAESFSLLDVVIVVKRAQSMFL
jgi:hypothetical protein